MHNVLVNKYVTVSVLEYRNPTVKNIKSSDNESVTDCSEPIVAPVTPISNSFTMTSTVIHIACVLVDKSPSVT